MLFRSVRVAHSAGQSHVPLFVNLLNEIVSEEPSAPQKRWWFNFVVAFVRVAHSVRQCHGQFILNLFNEIVSEEPSAPQKRWWSWYVNLSFRQF